MFFNERRMGVVAALTLGIAAPAVMADVQVSYRLGDADADAIFIFDGTNLTMADNVDFDVTVNGVKTDFDDADVSFSAVITAPSPFGGTFDGSFIVDSAGGTNVLTVNFEGAEVIVLGSGATIYFDSFPLGSGPDGYVAGPAFPALPAGEFLGGDQDFVFTLTNVTTTLSGFTAESSMSGSAELIPEPASLALVGCGAMLILRKRK